MGEDAVYSDRDSECGRNWLELPDEFRAAKFLFFRDDGIHGIAEE